MSDFSFTNFSHASARFKSEAHSSLEQLKEDFLATSAERKDLLPWIKLALFGNLLSSKGSLRHDANVLSITGCEGDYDAEQIPFDEAVQKLNNYKIYSLVYTSPSHTAEKPRWRVIAPFSKELDPKERARMVARLNGVLGGVLSVESFTLSQSYYFGHLNRGDERAEVCGELFLDTIEELDEIAIGKSGKKQTNGNGGDYHDFTELNELIRRIIAGEALHTSVTMIAGKFARERTPRAACIDVVGNAFMAANCDRYDARWPECLEAINWVYDKEEAKQKTEQQESTAPQAFPWVWDKTDWDDYPPPEQEWTVPNRIPQNQVCLLSGHGATGKSTIGLYLAATHVLAVDWLKSLPAPGSAFFVDAEDDINVIHRRLHAIKEHCHVPFEKMFAQGLHLLPMAGEDCMMAAPNRDGKLITTPFYKHMLERAGDHKPKQIVLASSANFFGGNESDRAQVMAFIGMLKKLAMVAQGSVVLITHPSLTGLNTQTHLSGSTHWHNSVRARMILKAGDNGAEQQDDSDIRVLEFHKNQYGKMDAPITLKWVNGMFLPMPEETNYEAAARMSKHEQVFTACLRRFLDRDVPVNHHPTSPTYAPKRFVQEVEAIEAKSSVRDLKAAMDRLIDAKKIEIVPYGRKDKPNYCLKFPVG